MNDIPLMTKQKFREKSGMGRDLLIQLIKQGVIPTVRLGGRSEYINVVLLEKRCLTGEIDDLISKVQKQS